MNDNDLVSVVIPTYRRSEMLPRAINSVLNQTYEDIEIIVVDDNNPNTKYREATKKIMEHYKDNSKIKYIKHDVNKNGSAARNTGIKYSSGKYVCFLDDDDYFYPCKIEKQLEFLTSNPEYKAVYCGWRNDNKEYIPYRSGNLMYEQFIGNNI